MELAWQKLDNEKAASHGERNLSEKQRAQLAL